MLQTVVLIMGTVAMVRVFEGQIAIISQARHWTSSCTSFNRLIFSQTYSPDFDISLAVHLNIFILILTNLMH